MVIGFIVIGSQVYASYNPDAMLVTAITRGLQDHGQQENNPLQLTAEMSLYPLQQDYIPVIRSFIETAAKREGLVLITNAMSTQVCGDWDAVISLVDQCLKASYQRFGKQVLVCKFIPGELDIAG